MILGQCFSHAGDRMPARNHLRKERLISVCHTEEVMVEVTAAGAAEKTRKQKEETWRQGQMITFKPSPSDL